MSEELNKKDLTEEELNKVNGGAELHFDFSVPEYCKPVNVEDGDNNSAICPYDGSILEYKNHRPSFADWLFECKKCNKWFSKTWDGKWYVSDQEPQ